MGKFYTNTALYEVKFGYSYFDEVIHVFISV